MTNGRNILYLALILGLCLTLLLAFPLDRPSAANLDCDDISGCTGDSCKGKGTGSACELDCDVGDPIICDPT